MDPQLNSSCCSARSIAIIRNYCKLSARNETPATTQQGHLVLILQNTSLLSRTLGCRFVAMNSANISTLLSSQLCFACRVPPWSCPAPPQLAPAPASGGAQPLLEEPSSPEPPSLAAEGSSLCLPLELTVCPPGCRATSWSGQGGRHCCGKATR